MFGDRAKKREGYILFAKMNWMSKWEHSCDGSRHVKKDIAMTL